MNDAVPGRGPRILVSYFFGDDTIPLGGSCVRALRALGCEVEPFDCRIEHPLQRRLFVPAGRVLRAFGLRGVDPSRWFGLDNEAVRQQALRAAVERFDPDLLLVMRGNHYRREFLAGLKARHRLRIAAWWLYGPEAHDQLVPELDWYDQYFSIYQRPVPGHRIIHLPALALDPELYRSDAARTPYTADIAFVGRHSPRRDQVLTRLTDLPLSIWGPGWRRLKGGWLGRRTAGDLPAFEDRAERQRLGSGPRERAEPADLRRASLRRVPVDRPLRRAGRVLRCGQAHRDVARRGRTARQTALLSGQRRRS